MNKQSAKVKIKANDYSEIKIQTASVAKLFTREKRLYHLKKLQKTEGKQPFSNLPSYDQPPIADPINYTLSDHVPLTTCSKRDPEKNKT